MLFLLSALTAGLAMLVACDPDPVRPGGTPAAAYENLSQRAHVLNNLELAYNKRNITKYDELLDDNFTFVLSPGDVDAGLPPQWGRAEELQYNRDLFDVNYAGQGRCKSILLDVVWEDSLVWQAETMPSAPGETWYTATAYYRFKFEFEPDITFVNLSGAKAEFVVRNAGTDAAPHWQLVEMYDSDAILLSTFRVTRVGTTRESMTWGGIKALYR